VARALEVLALTQEDAGEWSAAQATYLQAIASYERAGDRSGATGARGNLGMLLLTMGQPEGAWEAISESLAAYESLDDKEGVATSLLNLGWVALATGASAEASSLIHKGVRLVGHLRHSDLIIASLEGLAALALHQQQAERAAMLLGVASAYADKIGVMLSSYEKHIHDQTVAAVRKMLGETAFESLFGSGTGMSVEAALRNHFEGENGLRSSDAPDVG
jgi:Tfp pilus assembly protein PilF